jgi:hypothetical protein
MKIIPRFPALPILNSDLHIRRCNILKFAGIATGIGYL